MTLNYIITEATDVKDIPECWRQKTRASKSELTIFPPQHLEKRREFNETSSEDEEIMKQFIVSAQWQSRFVLALQATR